MCGHMGANGEIFRWKCEWCKNYFDVPLLDIRRGRGRFCSSGCKKNHAHAHGGAGVTKGLKRRRDDVIINIDEGVECE